MLPPELIHHILDFAVGDVDCYDSLNNISLKQRYQLEIEAGRRQLALKSSCLLVCHSFYAIMQNLIWSWVSILSWAKLGRVIMLLDQEASDMQTWNSAGRGGKRRLAYSIRRLDICLVFAAGEYNDDSTLVKGLARLIAGCPNLRVLITDLSVGGVDCQRTSPLLLDAIKRHASLRRLDFAGHEGPALDDYIQLISHLPNLEQLTTGRIAEPRMERETLLGVLDTLSEEQSLEAARPMKLSWPFIHTIQLSPRPVHSSLRLLQGIGLPNLRRLSIKNVNFFEPRVENFFSLVGHQLTHVYTYDIRSHTPPHGYRRLLNTCPKLQHLTFAVRQDDRHIGPWIHQNLESLGLRNVLPKTMPEEELAQNVSRAFMQTLRRITAARNDGQLKSFKLVKLEDEGVTPMQFMKTYGAEWAEECDGAGVSLVDSSGRRIPDDLMNLEDEPNMIVESHCASTRAEGLLPKVKRVLRLRWYRE